ncbi:hypothetical protein BSKO_00036 [Bryopsis sp. KO-2023]|nr:hypothetical protein BSKO_00036 [Bryopsis sp. KO-2023]
MSHSMEDDVFFDAEEDFGSSMDDDEFVDVWASASTEDLGPSTSYANTNGQAGFSINSEGSEWSKCDPQNYPLHMAAFDGDIPRLRALLKASNRGQKAQLDCHGNTVLHLAVLRENVSAVKEILDSGCPSKIRNSKGWSALDEAISARSRELVSMLHSHGVKELKTELKQAKNQLLRTLGELPDYSLELNWQLGSAVFGMMLRKFAPHDTYKINKKGAKIRVDGTLMGIEKNTSGLIPEWKRGKFSLLFDGSKTPAQVFLVFHEKGSYLDITEEKASRKKAGQFELDADVIIADGAGRTKLRAVDFRFKPVKGWLGGETTEKIEGWNTKVYEASGKMVAVTHLKSDWHLPADATFEDYLQMVISEDVVVEMPVNLNNMGGKNRGDGETAGSDADKNKKGKARKLTGRCWMAEDFPMSLQQLLPLLDVVGHANKHLGKVAKFMRKYGDMNMFPVKIQIPLLLTVYLLVSFKKFKFTEPDDKTSFEVPEGYKKVSLDELMSTNSKSKRKNPSPIEEDQEASPFEMKEEEVIDF